MSKKAIERWVKNIHQEARDGEKSYPQEFNIMALQKFSCKIQLFWRFFLPHPRMSLTMHDHTTSKNNMVLKLASRLWQLVEAKVNKVLTGTENLKKDLGSNYAIVDVKHEVVEQKKSPLEQGFKVMWHVA